MERFIVCAFEANFQNIMKGWAICAYSSLHRSLEIVLYRTGKIVLFSLDCSFISNLFD